MDSYTNAAMYFSTIDSYTMGFSAMDSYTSVSVWVEGTDIC